MIKSKYILDILDLTFDDFENEDLLRQQISFLKEKEREHTGVGQYVYFSAADGIENHRIPTENSLNFDSAGIPIVIIDGVTVKNNELNILSDAMVHIRNGLIDHIEIWNKNGEDYPLNDPIHYELTQSYMDKSQNRTIIR